MVELYKNLLEMVKIIGNKTKRSVQFCSEFICRYSEIFPLFDHWNILDHNIVALMKLAIITELNFLSLYLGSFSLLKNIQYSALYFQWLGNGKRGRSFF